ncbi:MAG: DUF1385 domain-containing protein [Defluviitaleaceae bacterium]|nr:DUF1385 domain-containing protein [Defluviitaleaceae bacterium]
MEKEKPTNLGGQAVIEGVMMRGKTAYALAVRGSDGNIVVEDAFLKKKNPALTKIPVLRGILAFVDSMALGFKIITRSAELAGLDDDTSEPGKIEKFLTEKLGDKLNEIVIFISVLIAIVLSIGLFIMLPVFIGGFFTRITFLTGHSWAFGIIEGIVRFIIFLCYIYLVSLNKDVRRVYEYHGAEHKTINCLEHGEELTVDNVARHSRYHKRCGTSFLLFVMVISMIFFLFVRTDDPVIRIASRLLFVPFIAGVSYEVLRWAGRSKSKFVEIVSYPGIKLQGLTTKEPDEDQIECAILATEAVLAKESSQDEDE